MVKRISILGATGSIGKSTLDIIRENPDAYEIVALTAGSNAEALAELINEFKPECAVLSDESQLGTLRSLCASTKTNLAAGEEALCEAASRPCDWLMSAIVGVAGLRPTLAAIEAGHTIAFASKECLVSAGELMMQACKKNNATLLPVDSEHNAIFQVFHFAQHEHIARITLTASGGPFRSQSQDTLRNVTPEQAVAHPKWDMGAKISVDSATMMNKGLELIEAYHLFPVERDQIDMVVHPESIVHGLVHYKDGSVLAQLGLPDMRTPISYCLSYPNRMSVDLPQLDVSQLSSLHFEPVDDQTFRAPQLAKEALASGQAACTVLNAANEVAVEAFLQKRIGFLDITEIIESVLNAQSWVEPKALSDIFALDEEARSLANEQLIAKAA